MSDNKYYELLKADERDIQFNRILDAWRDFLALNDNQLEEQDIFINKRVLTEVIERVSKRKYYFEVFHRLHQISEYKEVALYVFWLTKLKPFTVIKEESRLCESVNELFAVHLVLSIFQAIQEKREIREYSIPNSKFLEDLIYGLRYQDFTKESLIVYVEALAASCGLPVFSENIGE